jgi:hypothetical protein
MSSAASFNGKRPAIDPADTAMLLRALMSDPGAVSSRRRRPPLHC